MTRLSEALRRAAETADRPVTTDAAVPAQAWNFNATADAAPAATRDTLAAWPAAAVPSGSAAAVAPAGAARPAPRQSLRLGDADRAKLVLGEHVDHGLVEQYRHLAAVLHHAQKKSGARSVMVTSAVASEGKTLTATNLALTLSQSYQRRVLLVDADLRRPRMREMFALPDTEGLTDSLNSPRDGKLPVHQVSSTLWVLGAGTAVPDPMSLLVSPAMKDLLDQAGQSFDWVVVDTPPIAILPDANLLASMIDTALLVVSARTTPYPLAQRAALAIGPQRILGVVLNRAEHLAVPLYNYYGARGYRPTAPAPPRRRRWLPWRRKSRPQPESPGLTAG